VSEPPSVIIVDDEKHVRLSSAQTLGLEGFRVATFARAHDALPHLSAAYPGVVISDIRMPGMDGMAFLERVVEIDPHLPVALITGHGDVALAVKAMRAGAYDFIEKPFEGEHLIEMVRRALEMRRLVLENRSLRHALAGDDELGRRLIGRSDATDTTSSKSRSRASTSSKWSDGRWRCAGWFSRIEACAMRWRVTTKWGVG